jgi:hypothetical protein
VNASLHRRLSRAGECEERPRSAGGRCAKAPGGIERGERQGGGNPVSVHHSGKSGVSSSFLSEKMNRHRITPTPDYAPEKMNRHRITRGERQRLAWPRVPRRGL